MKNTIPTIYQILNQTLLIFSFVILSLLLLEFNYSLTEEQRWIIQIGYYVLMGLYVLHTVSLALKEGGRFFQSYDLLVKAVIIGALAITYTQPALAAGLIILEESFRALRSLMQRTSVSHLFERMRTQPALLLAVSFGVLIAMGSALLSLPIATVPGKINILDAIFMATSATCVTGLTTLEVGSFFTPFGQGVILALIQLGGLGIMTLSTSLALLIGKRLSISERLFMQNILEETDYQEFARLVKNIFRMTFIAEALGALILTLRWNAEFNHLGEAFYYGVFHSISAYCNAGFSLFHNSLQNYQSDPVVNLTITTLVVLGGLGFAVVYGTYAWTKLPKPRRLNLHLKMTLTITLVLLVGGTLFIFFTEYSGALLDLSLTEKLWTSWFQSVTLRTAGFSTIDFNLLSTGTLFMAMVFMFIGGSPGSTAGGVKTTTVGVLFVTLRGMLLGQEKVQAFERTVPESIIRKSISITFLGTGIVTVGVIGLSLVEPFTLKEALFEVVSASGTVGLSLGATENLTGAGKLIITALMYMGRIGPLTVAFLIGLEKTSKGYDLPLGKIVVG